MTKPAILFVCLGNICRSPMAEGAFRAAAHAAGLDVATDSAGTAGYHIGKAPDPRAIDRAARHGVDISGLRARQVEAADFGRFSHIFAMDHQNLHELEAIRPDKTGARLALLLDIVPGREGAAVADPYYGGEENFSETWQDVDWAAQALVTMLKG